MNQLLHDRTEQGLRNRRAGTAGELRVQARGGRGRTAQACTLDSSEFGPDLSTESARRHPGPNLRQHIVPSQGRAFQKPERNSSGNRAGDRF
jgi:hypothetical protein